VQSVAAQVYNVPLYCAQAVAVEAVAATAAAVASVISFKVICWSSSDSSSSVFEAVKACCTVPLLLVHSIIQTVVNDERT
jgi:hypothetical protein